MEWMFAALAVGVGVVLAAIVTIGVAAVVAVVVLRRRRARVDPAAREDMLRGVGFLPAGAGKWAAPVDDGSLVFEDGEAVWRWTMRLPRYNTMSLAIHEKGAANGPINGAFESRLPELDARFIFSSMLAARSMPLVTNREVANAMLAIHYLSATLSADELVIEDKGLVGMQRAGATTEVGTSAALEPEAAVQRAIVVFVHVLMRVLYSRDTGTIMEAFR